MILETAILNIKKGMVLDFQKSFMKAQHIISSMKGYINHDTGYLVDLKDLSKLIQKNVTDKLDHKNLNLDVEFLKNGMTSTEILVFKIWDELSEEVISMGAQLHKVLLFETENNSAEYYGE